MTTSEQQDDSQEDQEEGENEKYLHPAWCAVDRFVSHLRPSKRDEWVEQTSSNWATY